MPARIMAMFAARAGTSRAQLIEHYEDGYVPLIARLLPFVQRHRRHYVTNERSPALVAVGSPFVETGLDVIAEWIVADRVDEAEINRALADHDVRSSIAKVEAEFCDAAHTKRFAVKTVHADPVPLAPRPAGFEGAPAIRTFVLLQKNAAMSYEQFINHYENSHVPLVLKHLARNDVPLFATYIRNYPMSAKNPNVADMIGKGAASYDALSEICYWNEADAEQFGPCMAKQEAVAAFAKENRIMLRPDGFRMVQVNTYGHA